MMNRFTPIVAGLLLLGAYPTSADDKSVQDVGHSTVEAGNVGSFSFIERVLMEKN